LARAKATIPSGQLDSALDEAKVQAMGDQGSTKADQPPAACRCVTRASCAGSRGGYPFGLSAKIPANSAWEVGESNSWRTRKGPVRPGLGGTGAMRREYVVITSGEVAAALLTLGIMTFLLLV
jgi:hypothetical protein